MINQLLKFIFQPENKLEYLEQLLQMNTIPWYRIDLNIKKWWLESNFETIANNALIEINDAFAAINTMNDLIQKEEMLEALSLRLEKEEKAYCRLLEHRYSGTLKSSKWFINENNFFGSHRIPKLQFLKDKLPEILISILKQLNKDEISHLRQKKSKWTEYAIQYDQFDLLYEIEQAFKDTDYDLIEGPLQKSVHTDELVAIVHKLLLGKKHEFQKKQDKTILLIDGINYNWNEIIEYANLEQIKLEPESMLLYSSYMDKCKENIGYMVGTKSKLNPDLEKEYKEKLYANAALDHDYIEPVISFQEMQAIHMYTTEWSRLINGILRNTEDTYQTPPNIFKFALIQAVFCASGLNKLPKTKLVESVTRGENYHLPNTWPLAKKIQIERTKAAAVQGVIEMKGFISTSLKRTLVSNVFFTADIQLNIATSKGADISSISVQPEENECLMPPTRMRVTKYSGRYFTLQPTSDVSPDERTKDVNKNFTL